MFDLGWNNNREMIYTISITQVLFFLKVFLSHCRSPLFLYFPYIDKEKLMKQIKTYFLILFLIFITNTSIIAEDNTQVGLPDGAIARLGKGGINIMRFSPDGSYLAVGTDVGVWLYELPHAKETALFTGHTGHVNALAFSPDGKYLASGGFNNPIIQVWDVESKRKHSAITISDDHNVISNLAFYGRTLISIDGAGGFSYWNIDTGSKLSSIKFEDFCDVYAFSDDGSRLVGADREISIHLWDTTTNVKELTFERNWQGDDNDVLALAISPENHIIANAGGNKTIQLWDSNKDAELAILSGHDAWITALAFSEDGKTLASGDAGKVIKLWDLEKQEERVTLTGHKNTINALTFAPIGTPLYGNCLASSSMDGTIRFWNPHNGKELALFTTGHTENIKAVAFSKDDSTLTSAAFNGSVDTWDLMTHQRSSTFSEVQSDTSETVALSNDAQYYIFHGSTGMIWFKPDGFGMRGSTSGSFNIQVWDLIKNEKLNPLWQVGLLRSPAVTISPDNNIIAIDGNKDILGLHFRTSTELFKLNMKQTLHEGKLIFSPDGQKLAAVSEPQKPQVWDIATQRDITPSNIKNANAIAFSPDSSTLAAVSYDGIYFWQLDKDSEKRHTLIPAKLGRFDIQLNYSPDGQILVSSGMDIWTTTLKLWHVDTGTYLGNLSGHTESIESLVFSHDGKTLASGSQDGTVLLWDWNKISTKLKSEKLGKEVTNNLITVPDPIKFDGKAEEAEVVLNWLNDKGYQITKLNNGYRVTRNGSTSTISGGGGTMSVGDVTVTVDRKTVDRKGVLDIRTEVGSANFIFDAKGNLKYKTTDNE